MASAAKQDYEWQQDFKTSLITVEFAVPRGTRADAVYVEASQRKLAAGVYGKEPNVCGTLLFPIDVQQTNCALKGDKFVIRLVPETPTTWARLCVKNDPDALYICKVKAHTPWAPKKASELRLRVGDVVGVTRYVSSSVWYGEVFNTAAKHEAGEFNPKLARHLTEEELDDLLIVSKHGFLECNGKKQFLVLHGGQLFRYNDAPARDKTAKQLAKAQASVPIDENTSVSNIGNRKDALRVVASDGTQLDLVGERELIGDWQAVLQQTIARAVAQNNNASDQRATIRVKRAQQEQRDTEAVAIDAAWDEFEADLDIDFSDIETPRAASSTAAAPVQQPVAAAAATSRPSPARATAPPSTIAPVERRRPSTTPSPLELVIDGGATVQHLFNLSSAYAEFLEPTTYVTDQDQAEIERLTRELCDEELDPLPAVPVAAAAPPPLMRASSRTREAVMADIRSLKMQYDVGEVDESSFAAAKQVLLDELSFVGGVAGGERASATAAAAAVVRAVTPPPPSETPPPPVPPQEPEDDEAEPPPPSGARPWNDVSELALLDDLDEMVAEEQPRKPLNASGGAAARGKARGAPDWNNMDADQLFDEMLNTATLQRGEFVDDEPAGATEAHFFTHNSDDELDLPPEPPAPEPPAPTVAFPTYDPYGDSRSDAAPAPPRVADTLGGGVDDDDDLPEMTMTKDGVVMFTQSLSSSSSAATQRPTAAVRDAWDEEEAERRLAYNGSEATREAEERIRRLQAERQTIVVSRQQSSPSPARRPGASSSSSSSATTLSAATMTLPSPLRSGDSKRDVNESQVAFLLHVYERRVKAGMTHQLLRRQCRRALKVGEVLTVLDMSRCHMGDNDLKLLAQGFDDYRVESGTAQLSKLDLNILTLKLSDNDFRSSEQNVGNIRTILRATLRVKHLYLAGLGLTEKDIAALNEARFLASLPLETLDLSRNPLGNAGLARLIEGFEACHTLRTLSLMMCQLTDKHLTRWDALFGTPPLLHLNVSYNKLGDAGVRHLMSLAARRQRLLSFEFGENGCRPSTAEVMAKWLNHNQQLQVLRCEGNDCTGFGLLLGKALAKHRALQELDVSRCSLGKQMHYVIRGAGLDGSLRRLHLSQHALPIPAQQQLVKTLNDGFSRITHLYVRDCTLARKAIAAIFTYAGRSDSSLEHLDIACNDFDSLKLVEHIGACVLDAPVLRTLHVAATGLTNETLMPLLRAARDSRSLKALHLDGHPKAKRWLQLAAKLVNQSKSGIEELTLRNSNVTEEDALYFVDFFRTTLSGECALKKLRLERNKGLEKPAVRDAIAQAVSRTQQANPKFRMAISFVPDPETAAGIRRTS